MIDSRGNIHTQYNGEIHFTKTSFVKHHTSRTSTDKRCTYNRLEIARVQYKIVQIQYVRTMEKFEHRGNSFHKDVLGQTLYK